MTYPVLDNSGIDIKKAFMLNPTLWCALSLVVPLAASLISVLFRSNMAESLSRGSSMTRWLGESLFSPLVLVILMAMWGFNDIFTLVGAFTTNHAAIVFLSVMDVANYPGKKTVTWWPYYASLWLSTLGILPVLLVLIFSAGSTSDLPGLLLAGTVLVIISSVLQVLLQRSYYMSVESPNDRQIMDGASTSLIKSEVKQLMVGSPMKVTALLLVALTYTGSDDWTWRHNAATSCLIESTPVNGTSVPTSCVMAGVGARQLSGKKIYSWYKGIKKIEYSNTADKNLDEYNYFDTLESSIKLVSSGDTCKKCAAIHDGYWCTADSTCYDEAHVCGSASDPKLRISNEHDCPVVTRTTKPDTQFTS